jgi:shikimate kinase
VLFIKAQSARLSPTSAAIVAKSDSFVAIGGGDVARDEMLAARRAGKPVIFIPADMNHRIAREKARQDGLPEPTDFRGSAHAVLVENRKGPV